MQYKTNQLDQQKLFSFENYKNINQDFWVCKFTTNNPSYQYSLIDDLKQEFPYIKSVVYLQGKNFYALCEKSAFKNDYELESEIKKIIKNNEEINVSVLTNLYDKNEIDKRHLAQLLFNSLANISDKNKNKTNITGSLFWVVKAIQGKEKATTQKIIWQYVTLKLELDYHLHLKLDVKTFSNVLMTGKIDFTNRKIQLKDYTRYEILSDNIRSMRRLKNNEQNPKSENVYILAQADGKKSKIPFLEFLNWQSFEESKSGVLYNFLKEVEEQLKKYVTVNFIELPFNEQKIEFDKQLSENVKDRIKSFYLNIPIVINIADSLKEDKEANELAQKICEFLQNSEKEYNISNVCINDLDNKALNIRIIRNKSYYETNRVLDEYCKDKNYLVHHITTDDFDINLSKTKSDALNVILKESYIKKDIKQGKITILDWNFGEWIFMCKEEVKEKNESQDKIEKKYNYQLLKVSENGDLTYETCFQDHMFSNKDYEGYKVKFQYNDKFNGREFLSCLLVSNQQDINLIFETPLFTIQEIQKIGDILALESQETEYTKNQILKMLEKFIQENKNFESDPKLVQTLSYIEAYKNTFNKDDLNSFFLKQGLSNKTKIKKAFCDFYYENSERFLNKKDVLHAFFKSKEDIEELFASNTNIYYQINNDTEGFYFAGIIPTKVQTSFINATNIRKIKAIDNLQGQPSKLVFDKLLPTMNVDFVKHGSLTVLPFAFKYLREMSKYI